MKRWTKEHMLTGEGLARQTVRHRLQIQHGGNWTTVATVVETTDGRWMAGDVWGNGAGQAHRALTKAKAEAEHYVEGRADWGVPW